MSIMESVETQKIKNNLCVCSCERVMKLWLCVLLLMAIIEWVLYVVFVV